MNDKHKATVLVVDDDHAHRLMLKTLLEDWNYSVAEADDGDVAVALVAESAFDLILMDVRMVKMSGLEALPQIKALNPAIPILIMTAYSSVETAVEAIKNGAQDYLIKPLDFDKLDHTIEYTMEHVRLKTENQVLKARLSQSASQDLIAQSPAMRKIIETATLVAPALSTVLLHGESGTGKEVLASFLHYNSNRAAEPFIKLNCAAITETLLESELFGHEKGSFTGADRRKEGRFVQANHGTLFLDEIGEMPMPMQAKLLRVLQEKEFSRVGGEEVLRVDVRLIAATNRNLLDLVTTGKFREDLYHRLNVIRIDLPPLRDRSEDIPLLAALFINKFSELNAKKLQGFTPQAMNMLTHYHWPGNVRELSNAIERAVVLCPNNFLDLNDFDQSSPQYSQASSGPKFASLDDVERLTIVQTLDDCKGNKSEAARRLGITRKTLHKKLKSYGLMV